MREAIAARTNCEPNTFDARFEALSKPLRDLNEGEVRARFELPAAGRLLKTTLTLCEVCLAHVPGAVYANDGRVLLASRCAHHGVRVAVIENDERYYRLSSKDRWGRRYGGSTVLEMPAFSGCCGPSPSCTGKPRREPWRHDSTDQRANKTCTVLVEITNACNLACRVCYADSRGDRVLPLERFKAYLERLIEEQGELESVQITGGEASLHPQFWEMLAWLHGRDGVRKIYLPTNGIELSKPAVAAKLRPFRDKLLVLLQFDGADFDTNKSLRRSQPLKVRQRLIRALDRNSIAMQLTMTLAHGISEREIAWVVRQGVAHRNVRLIGMLPAFFSGRYELSSDPMRRLTLSDVVKGGGGGPAPPRAGGGLRSHSL